MRIHAATLLLVLRTTAAAAQELRGRDLFGPRAPRGPRGLSSHHGGASSSDPIGDCSTELEYSFDQKVTRMKEVVAKNGATDIQLNLSGTKLAPGSWLVLETKGNGDPVKVDAAALRRGNGWSPVVAGDRITVGLAMDDKAKAKGDSSHVVISSYRAVGICDPQDPQTKSICGDIDDRELSSDQRLGRMTVGCTAYLISEDVFVTAGHCDTPASYDRLHLGIENSYNSAPLDMQFAVELDTYDGVDGGRGNSWAVGRLLPNSQTGLKAGESNGGVGWYELGDVPSDTAGNIVRITGYGSATNHSKWQKTHTGDLVSIGPTWLAYRAHTTGGTSGAPVVLNDGYAIGVHAHPDCTSSGGGNVGTRIDRPEFAAKIETMLASDRPTSSPAPSVESTSRPTMNCLESESRIRVEIWTDKYPEETSWDLVDSCSSTVVASGDTDDHDDDVYNFVYEYCLPSTEHQFTIRDSYGDGICCRYGAGEYKVFIDGELEASGGDFGSEEEVTFGGSCSPSSSSAPSTAHSPVPSRAMSDEPSSRPTMTCLESESRIRVEIQTDKYPGETSWDLVDSCSSIIVASRDDYDDKNSNFVYEYCLPLSEHQFTIRDSYGDGICCDEGEGEYKVFINGELEASGGDFGSEEEVTFGGSCSPTSSPAPSHSPSPSHAPSSSRPTMTCLEFESRIRVDIWTDKEPQETSWDLVDLCSLTAVASGDYDGYDDDVYNFVYEYCLPSTEHQFIIRDRGGDGICCDEGEGKYKIFVDGELAGSGGDFEFQEEVTFGGSCSPTSSPAAPSVSPTGSPSSSVFPSKTPSVTPIHLPSVMQCQAHSDCAILEKCQHKPGKCKCRWNECKKKKDDCLTKGVIMKWWGCRNGETCVENGENEKWGKCLRQSEL